MDDDDQVARSRGVELGDQRDRITDALTRHQVIAILLGVAAFVLGGTGKVLSAEGSDIPGWLAVAMLAVGLPVFAWMGWRVYLWLQRQRGDADGSLHMSEQRPTDRPSPD